MWLDAQMLMDMSGAVRRYAGQGVGVSAPHALRYPARLAESALEAFR